MNSYILALIINASLSNGLDPMLVMSVIKVESNYNIDAIGSKGEIGLMQLMPKSFPHYSRSELMNPETNIRLGVSHLRVSKMMCHNRPGLSWLDCYNRGIRGANRIRYIKDSRYVKKIKMYYKELR